MVIEGVCESKEASDGAVGEKKVKFCENSVLVAPLVLIFAFFPYPASARAWVVAA